MSVCNRVCATHHQNTHTLTHTRCHVPSCCRDEVRVTQIPQVMHTVIKNTLKKTIYHWELSAGFLEMEKFYIIIYFKKMKIIYSVYPEWHMIQFIGYKNQILQRDILVTISKFLCKAFIKGHHFRYHYRLL